MMPDRCTQYVSPTVGLNWLTMTCPVPAIIVRGASQSVPTASTIEFGRVVTTVPSGAPLAALNAPLAAATSDDAAPVNVMTVSDAAWPMLFIVAETVMAACAAGEDAHQISAVPSCTLERTALVHVRPPPVTPVTSVFGAQHGSGASAETNATSSVPATGVTDGLVIV